MGAPGGPEVMGCAVTQPPILFSFVERKKGVGVIYQIDLLCLHIPLGKRDTMSGVTSLVGLSGQQQGPLRKW